MARVSGWYKRKTQVILLVIGAVLVLALNANTLTIANRLWSDQSIRAAVVQQADQAASQPTGDDPRERLENAADDVASVAKLGVPMGWSGEAKPDWSGTGWATVLGGWLLTVLAISLGAPFWFDTLGRLSRLRSTGKPETPLPATGSGKPMSASSPRVARPLLTRPGLTTKTDPERFGSLVADGLLTNGQNGGRLPAVVERGFTRRRRASSTLSALLPCMEGSSRARRGSAAGITRKGVARRCRPRQTCGSRVAWVATARRFERGSLPTRSGPT